MKFVFPTAAGQCPPPALTVPEIMHQLWRIADDCRPDPAMRSFVDHVLVALEDLIRLREAAYQITLEAAAEPPARRPRRAPPPADSSPIALALQSAG